MKKQKRADRVDLVEYVKANNAGMTPREMAEATGWSLTRVYDTIIQLGLKKTKKWHPKPNETRVEGDVTYLWLRNQKLWAQIDTADYHLISRYRWYAWRAKADRTWYVRAVVGPEMSNVFLHRFLMATPEGLVVDHLNHDGTDCRRANMRNTTQRVNSNNRSPAYHAKREAKQTEKAAAKVRAAEERRQRLIDRTYNDPRYCCKAQQKGRSTLYVVKKWHDGVLNYVGCYHTPEDAKKALIEFSVANGIVPDLRGGSQVAA